MDLATSYMGLPLRNPLVASASPLSNTVDGVQRLADSGVGAVVLYSLFEEQVRQEMDGWPKRAPSTSPSRCPISRPG
jgi:dihydroorotate dehydrogenase (fumarate)